MSGRRIINPQDFIHIHEHFGSVEYRFTCDSVGLPFEEAVEPFSWVLISQGTQPLDYFVFGDLVFLFLSARLKMVSS